MGIGETGVVEDECELCACYGLHKKVEFIMPAAKAIRQRSGHDADALSRMRDTETADDDFDRADAARKALKDLTD